MGPEISEHLGIPQISYVAGLQYDEASKKFTVTKETEDGCQILEFQGKALLTCLASAVKPRYMTVGGIVDAYGKAVAQCHKNSVESLTVTLDLQEQQRRRTKFRVLDDRDIL